MASFAPSNKNNEYYYYSITPASLLQTDELLMYGIYF
jgi:hypothetical protein